MKECGTRCLRKVNSVCSSVVCSGSEEEEKWLERQHRPKRGDGYANPLELSEKSFPSQVMDENGDRSLQKINDLNYAKELRSNIV